MNEYIRALAAGAAAACLGGTAQAEGGINQYDGTVTGAYSDSFVLGAVYDYQPDPVVVAPVPRVYYAPVYTQRLNTSYYYGASNHDPNSLSSPGYTTVYEPRLVYSYAPPAATYYDSRPAYAAPSQPYGYVPPGLSITTPAGTYAPFYGGWSSYSLPNSYGTTPRY